ncbi:ferredoxin [Nocardioides sp. GXZ039]|uniref:ferredoxin n=1 Tax=Nocardioides sp. GXZ039 TaxID=3136018 RepID=UPI0030F3852C
MSLRVVADLDACQGYANCLVNAPDVFDLSDDGKVVVLDVDLDTVDRTLLDEAIASCPATALRLVEGA